MTTYQRKEFCLPDVGEGLVEAEIVTWRVQAGDTVEINQILVEIETAKSNVELPSPWAGRVERLLVEVGATVPVGAPIVSIAAMAEPREAAPELPSQSADDPGAGGDEPRLLVGYGASESHSRRRRARRGSAAAEGTEGRDRPPSSTDDPETTASIRAKPPVRKLAQVLGVDLHTVSPTGPSGTVTRDDVFAAQKPAEPPTRAGLLLPSSASADGDRRIPIQGIRKHTAAAIVTSVFTAPHATEFVTVDVTRTLQLRDIAQRRDEFADVKLTPLALVARAYLVALGRTPMANARWDDAAQEIVVPGHVNLGIAVATPRGLIVPNIRDAHRLSVAQLAGAIRDLAERGRAGKTPPEAMAGGTTTITNIGVFGVDTGTPILNPGETSILAVGAIRRMPWVVDDEGGERIEIRSVVQLALSFDHRVIDGQEGSNVLSDTASLLAEPGLALL